MSLHDIAKYYNLQTRYDLKRKGCGRRKQPANKAKFRDNFEAYVFQLFS